MRRLHFLQWAHIDSVGSLFWPQQWQDGLPVGMQIFYNFLDFDTRISVEVQIEL